MAVIATNTAANSAVRYLNINSKEETSSLSKLASGSRITQASDDAAGLAIATRLSTDVTSLEQAATNSSHAVSILQTADGGASSISDILQRMKSLASEAASGTVGSDERAYLQEEFGQLKDEVDATASSTRYNSVSLLSTQTALTGSGNITAATGGTINTTNEGKISVTVGSNAAVSVNVTNGETSSDLVSALNTALGSTATASVDSTTGKILITAASTSDAVSVADASGNSNGTTAALGLSGTSASGVLTGTVKYAAGSNGSVTAGDVDVTIGSSTQTVSLKEGMSANDVADAINTAFGSSVAGVDSSGNLKIASADGLAVSVADSTSGSGVAASLGFGSGNTSVDATTSSGNPDYSGGVNVVVGSDKSDTISIKIGSLDSTTLGLSNLDISTSTGANSALDAIDSAINDVSSARASLGAQESRFEFRSDTIATSQENLTSAVSVIKDTDVAAEEATLASAQVKTQAAVAAASQANQMTQQLLKLMQ